ncbi:hypothetical protein [Nocardioides nitrophenolicus]|uniref:hypothetical protein n=1 Tax=Nocardioides nitrophenolicus TaxID=60489 RepID=UPI0019591015|nr:hypothetical protein [Nocardioides nitrophenolicus]MBM7515800.1 hypothetical protein [Nocardioides nitrophenolicus]
MSLVLDTGALLAVEWRHRAVLAKIRTAQAEGVPVRTSSGAVAQVWRDGARQALLATTLRGIDERPIDPGSSRRIGRLLAETGTSDIVVAHVAVLCDDDSHLLTSDPGDLDQLLRVLGRSVTIKRV